MMLSKEFAEILKQRNDSQRADAIARLDCAIEDLAIAYGKSPTAEQHTEEFEFALSALKRLREAT